MFQVIGELYDKTIAAVKAQIDYDSLIMHNDKGLIDDIVITMADVMTIDRSYYVVRGDFVVGRRYLSILEGSFGKIW